MKNVETYGCVQWNGTDVCIDIHCVCGTLEHFDGMCFDFYECPECHRKYKVGCDVKFVEMDEAQIKDIEENQNGFQTINEVKQ